MRSATLSFAAAAFALIVATPAWTANPGAHPAYLHALSDLRDARAHLEHLASEPVDQQEERAIAEIDKAIDEIKRAAIMDGKNIQDHVQIDAHLVHNGRLHKALELLDRAKADVSGEEDQPDTRGLRARVVQHIDEARHTVAHTIGMVLGGR